MSDADATDGSVRRIGRYAVHGEIASGGMASVHIGRLLGEVGFARTVAIKRLHSQFAKDPDFVAMFIDEARLASRINAYVGDVITLIPPTAAKVNRALGVATPRFWRFEVTGLFVHYTVWQGLIALLIVHAAPRM